MKTTTERESPEKRKQQLRDLNKELWHKTLQNLELFEPLIGSEADEADKEYCRLMRTLSTEVLDEILKGHDEGLCIRKPNTIQEILSELADRSLLQ